MNLPFCLLFPCLLCIGGCIADPAPVCEPPCSAVLQGEEIVDCYCPREKW